MDLNVDTLSQYDEAFSELGTDPLLPQSYAAFNNFQDENGLQLSKIDSKEDLLGTSESLELQT